MIRETKDKSEIANEIIQEIGRENLIGYFEQRLAEPLASSARQRLVEAYAYLSGIPALPMLLEICRSEQESIEVRAATIRALGNLKAHDAVPTLIEFLQTTPTLIVAAVKALSKIADARAEEPLVELLGHQDASVVNEVAQALVNMKAKSSVSKLREIVETIKIDELTAEQIRKFVSADQRIFLSHKSDNFVGRKKELQELLHSLRGEKNVVGIFGPAGSGKTSLARELAQRMDTYQKIWLSCDQYRSDELLREIAFQLGVDSDSTEWRKLAEHSGSAGRFKKHLYSLLSQTQCLLILDNFDAVSENLEILHFVGDFSRETKVKFVLTGRKQVNLPQITSFYLETWTPDEAKEFILKQGLDLDANELARLLEVTGGMPLLIALALDLIKQSGLDALDTELLKGENKDRIYHRMLGYTLDTLGTEELQTLRMLSLIRKPLSIDNSSIIDLFKSEGVDYVDRALGALRQYSFIRFEDEKYIIVHAIIADLISETLDLDYRIRLSKKIGDYYSQRMDDFIEAAYHYQAAGEIDLAIEVLSSRITSPDHKELIPLAAQLINSILSDNKLAPDQHAKLIDLRGKIEE